MDSNFQEIAPYLKDPLVLIGFFLFVSLLITRTIITPKLLEPLPATMGFRILRLVLVYGFIIGLLVILLGFGLKYQEIAEQKKTVASLEKMLGEALEGVTGMAEEKKKEIIEEFLAAYRSGGISKEEVEKKVEAIKANLAIKFSQAADFAPSQRQPQPIGTPNNTEVEGKTGSSSLSSPSSGRPSTIGDQQLLNTGAGNWVTESASTKVGRVNTSVRPPFSEPSVGTFVEDLGKGNEPEMVSLPGGEFTMGGDESDDEEPKHRVRVSPFAIGKYEVTQQEWTALMGENPSKFKGDTLPVENVSWNDAKEFCKKLSEMTGNKYRLPTEAEWEYAARAGSTGKYCFGDDERLLGDYAWYGKNSDKKTLPVGQKKPNAWGLYDMHGNVWEWCSDGYDGGYYKELAKRGVAIDPWGPSRGSGRVIRGGSWDGGAVYCRSACRLDWAPGYPGGHLGFRLVRVGRIP